MKSNDRDAIRSATVPWPARMFENSPSGKPAARAAASKRSPARRVWVACFNTTAFPATSTGAILLIAVRHG